MKKTNRLLILTKAMLLACCLSIMACEQKPVDLPSNTPIREITSDDISLNNRGVALMGYFDYDKARKAFDEAVERHPTWATAKVNLAIATLNRQLEGDEQLAIGYLQDVLQLEPENLRAHFVLGLLMERAGEGEIAKQHFNYVLENDPQDAYAAYYLAVNTQAYDASAALTLFEQAIASDPYLRSAYYGAFLLYMRSGDRERGEEMKLAYERMADNPRARLAETKYTRMGPKADALTVDLQQDIPLKAKPSGDLFGPVQTVVQLNGNSIQRSLTTVDLQRDGLQDIVIANANGANQVVIASDDEYTVPSQHELSRLGPSVALAWGDLDNDGNVDVVVCGKDGVNSLYQKPLGKWRSLANLKTLSKGKACQDVNLFDADHDGDLDVLAMFKGETDLLSNNGNLSFRSLVSEKHMQFAQQQAQHAVMTDLDNDRDVDIFLVNQKKSQHDVLINDRLWRYSSGNALDTLANSTSVAMAAADVDADGLVEMYSVDANGKLVKWETEDKVNWRASQFNSVSINGRAELDFSDFDGDGFLDLLVIDDNGIAIWSVGQNNATQLFEYRADVITAIPVVSDADLGPSLMALVNQQSKQSLIHFPPGPGRGNFISVSLLGKEEKADSMRSNREGIGTEISIRRGSHWTVMDTFDHHTGRGQSLQPVAIGLGTEEKADFVALNWSDGVFQTELDLVTGKEHRIAETQRQLSSCPVVFAWDGDQWNFVSDILGVAGIGFLHAPGTYGVPRPWEYFQLPSDLVKIDAGQVRLMITEPMEEIALIDKVELHAYQMAPGWHMIIDERMATSAPQVTGQALFFEQAMSPIKALRDDGYELTDSILSADQQAANLGPVHHQFLGRLAKERSMTIQFPRALDSGDGKPILRAHGWVEYPYSQTVFAAWQSDHFYRPPTLEAAGADGQWQVVHSHFGYPAGMPRTMALPLDQIPAGTTQLKISSNLEIYWDKIDVVFAKDPGNQVSRQDLLLAEAIVEYIGFPQRTNADQKRAQYDYQQRVPLWDTRYPKGNYTEFGEAKALVDTQDGAYAVIGPGEAIELGFNQKIATPAGWTTEYVLYTSGYAKDMDMYTQDSGTVGPLPEVDGANWSLHQQYNNRYQDGY